MKDAKGHGSDKRGGNGQFQKTSARYTNTVAERVAMRKLVDLRNPVLRPAEAGPFTGRSSNRNLPPNTTPRLIPGSGPARMDVPHMRSIEAATQGKTLATKAPDPKAPN